MNHNAGEVARLFNVELMQGGNAGEEVYPGHPGWVIGQHHMKTMHWGFPLALKGKQGQSLKPKPVNNTRSDKLDSRFWSASFRDRRCLIPVSAFAEAEGSRGRKTRTWLSVPDEPVFACAGIWRDSDEWAPVYSMVITEPSEQVRQVHDRMPVVLRADQHEEWLKSPPEATLALCRPYTAELAIERTTQPWVARR